MKRSFIIITTLLVFVFISSGFNGGPKWFNYWFEKDSVRFSVPANFPKPVYDFKNNPVTSDGFKLGRILFYDPQLSKDRSISCANCHQSFAAFANLNHPVSHGVDECMGTRNAPPLFNLAWQKEFMWDGGVHHIELSPLNAMTNPCEMNMDLKDLVNRLKESKAYPGLFKAAFGSEQINSQRMFRALAQFSAMLISANAKYDKHMRKEDGGDYTEAEAAGYLLFRKNCSTCHREPLFTDLSYRSNGLDEISDDAGRDSITHRATDKGKFRVPSLRNIELTAPYMHDGRFRTLKEVLAHYNSGVRPAVNLDPQLRQQDHLGIRLSLSEQEQLITFLKTLTDRAFVNDKRFQEPPTLPEKAY